MQYVEEGIDLTRNLARGFFSPELEADGLSVALDGLAENISERFAIKCVFHGEDSIPMRDSVAATQLYRIAQEAATNAAKHAAAENIDIRASMDGSEVTLAIIDDGVGFPDKVSDAKKAWTSLDALWRGANWRSIERPAKLRERNGRDM